MHIGPSHLLQLFICRFSVVLLVSVIGCSGSKTNEVVVYTALDREFSQPILERFESETGVAYRGKFDVESSKTVGLVKALVQESNRPRCDVFWNNEILHTLRLEEKGLLDVYLSPSARDYPSQYLSSTKSWHGFACRVRVLIVNTKLTTAAEPNSILDLIDPRWKSKVAMARPLFGTTATHAAVLFDTWGDIKAQEYYEKIRENVDIVSGNKQVAEEVANGRYAFGITDTDDAIIELEKGAPVRIVFPDQGEDGIGSLMIPNSLCIMKGCPNQENARKLVDFLLQEQTETDLAEGPSAQFPVNPNVKVKSRIKLPSAAKWMSADFESAAKKWDEASDFLRKHF